MWYQQIWKTYAPFPPTLAESQVEALLLFAVVVCVLMVVGFIVKVLSVSRRTI